MLSLYIADRVVCTNSWSVEYGVLKLSEWKLGGVLHRSTLLPYKRHYDAQWTFLVNHG